MWRGVRLLVVDGGRVRGEVPAAFLGGDIHDAAAASFLDPPHGLHRERSMRLRATGRPRCWERCLRRHASLRSKPGRNDERTAEHDRRAVDDVAHRLEFLLPVLQTAFEVGDRAAGVFQIQPHILAGRLIVLELHPAVGPEGDFLGEPFVDGGERLVDMGDAAIGHFAGSVRARASWPQGRGRAVPGRRESRRRRARL